MPEGSGIDRDQLRTFAVKADDAAQSMTGEVTKLDNNLQTLAMQSQGSFANRFREVKMQVQGVLDRMNKALGETSRAASAAAVNFDAGDQEQDRTVQAAGSQMTGLDGQLPSGSRA